MNNRFSGIRRTQLEGPISRRGAILVLMAAMLITTLIIVGLSIDTAYMQMTRVELRTATDAAVRAASESLSREQDTDKARLAAKAVAMANNIDGNPLLLEDADIEFGRSDTKKNSKWVFEKDLQPYNAVRVTGRKTDSSLSGGVPLFFKGLFGNKNFEPVKEATAVHLNRDICIVVDRSSSMKWPTDSTKDGMSPYDSRFCALAYADSRWVALAKAVKYFDSLLASTLPQEQVALVSYSSDYSNCKVSNAETTIDQNLTTDYALVDAGMDYWSNRVFNGNTNIDAGIRVGTEVLTDEKLARPFAVKTLILFTDGRYTGAYPVPDAEAAADAGVVIHTITYGKNANQTDMIAVAAATGGRHYHAPDPESLEKAFYEIAFTFPTVFTD